MKPLTKSNLSLLLGAGLIAIAVVAILLGLAFAVPSADQPAPLESEVVR